MPPHPLSRTRDSLLYSPFLLNFCLLALILDLQPLYPSHLIPSPFRSLHAFYITTFNDYLARDQPLWFQHFAWTEAIFEIPIGLWAAGQFRSLCKDGRGGVAGGKGRGKVYPVMVVWATVCAYTTWICVLEYVKSEVLNQKEKVMLVGMFGAYGVLCEYYHSKGVG